MILTCGESLIDMLPRHTPSGEDCFAPHAGGAVFNTAVALGRLGAHTGLLSGMSSDLFGQILRDRLEESGVFTGLAVMSDRHTTLAFVTLSGGQARYAFYDENTAGRMLRPEDMPALPAEVLALFFGGISLMVEPCASAYEALMTREAPARVTMIDPNIRPGFIRDEAAYRERLDRMLALADLVKLSDEDLVWLMGPGSAEEQARVLLDRGPKAVFITRGAEGAFAVTRNHRVQVSAPAVTVADTVGAGDTFNAGVLAALSEAGQLEKPALAELGAGALRAALELGVRAAAVTVARPGANPPRREELGT